MPSFVDAKNDRTQSWHPEGQVGSVAGDMAVDNDDIRALRLAVKEALQPGDRLEGRLQEEYPHYHPLAPDTPAVRSPTTSGDNRVSDTQSVGKLDRLKCPSLPNSAPADAASTKTAIALRPVPAMDNTFVAPDEHLSPTTSTLDTLTSPASAGTTVTTLDVPLGMEVMHAPAAGMDRPVTADAQALHTAIPDHRLPQASHVDVPLFTRIPLMTPPISPPSTKSSKSSHRSRLIERKKIPEATAEAEHIEFSTYKANKAIEDRLSSTRPKSHLASAAIVAAQKTLDQATSAGIPLHVAAAAAGGSVGDVRVGKDREPAKETLGWRGLRSSEHFLAPCDMPLQSLRKYLEDFTPPYPGAQPGQPYRGVVRPRRYHIQRKRMIEELRHDIRQLSWERSTLLGRFGLPANAPNEDIEDIEDEDAFVRIGDIDAELEKRRAHLLKLEDVKVDNAPVSLHVPKNKSAYPKHETDDRLWEELANIPPTLRRWSAHGHPYDLDRHAVSPAVSECSEAPTLSPRSSISNLSLASGASSTIRSRVSQARSERTSRSIMQTLNEAASPSDDAFDKSIQSQSRPPSPSDKSSAPDQVYHRQHRSQSQNDIKTLSAEEKKSRHSSLNSTRSLTSSTVSYDITPSKSLQSQSIDATNSQAVHKNSEQECKGGAAQAPASPPSKHRKTPSHLKPPTSGRIRFAALEASKHAEEAWQKLSPAGELERALEGRIQRIADAPIPSSPTRSSAVSTDGQAKGKDRSGDTSSAPSTSQIPLSLDKNDSTCRDQASQSSPPIADRHTTHSGSKRTSSRRDKKPTPTPEKIAERAKKDAINSQRWQTKQQYRNAKQLFGTRRDLLTQRLPQTKNEDAKGEILWTLAELYIEYTDLLGPDCGVQAVKIMQDTLQDYKNVGTNPERWLQLAQMHFLLDTMTPPADKHLHMGLETVQNVCQHAGDQSELAGTAYVSAARAIEDADHLPSGKYEYASGYWARSTKCPCPDKLYERYVRLAQCCDQVVREKKEKDLRTNTSVWRQKCLRAMRTACLQNPTDQYKAKLEYFRQRAAEEGVDRAPMEPKTSPSAPLLVRNQLGHGEDDSSSRNSEPDSGEETERPPLEQLLTGASPPAVVDARSPAMRAAMEFGSIAGDFDNVVSPRPEVPDQFLEIDASSQGKEADIGEQMDDEGDTSGRECADVSSVQTEPAGSPSRIPTPRSAMQTRVEAVDTVNSPLFTPREVTSPRLSSSGSAQLSPRHAPLFRTSLREVPTTPAAQLEVPQASSSRSSAAQRSPPAGVSITPAQDRRDIVPPSRAPLSAASEGTTLANRPEPIDMAAPMRELVFAQYRMWQSLTTMREAIERDMMHLTARVNILQVEQDATALENDAQALRVQQVHENFRRHAQWLETRDHAALNGRRHWAAPARPHQEVNIGTDDLPRPRPEDRMQQEPHVATNSGSGEMLTFNDAMGSARRALERASVMAWSPR